MFMFDAKGEKTVLLLMYNGEYHNPLGNPYQLTSVKGPFQVFEHF